VTIEPDARVRLELDAIPRAVVDAGFRAGPMWLRAEGEATTLASGEPAFWIASWPEPLPVDGRLDPGSTTLEARVRIGADGRVRLEPDRAPALATAITPRSVTAGTPR